MSLHRASPVCVGLLGAGLGLLGYSHRPAQVTVEAPRKPMRLGYWDIRGLAQPIRHLLLFTGTPHVETVYRQAGAERNFDKSAWYSVKYDLDLLFPNLPYLIDEAAGVRLTQSNAILRHIARVSGNRALLGTQLAERAVVDMTLAQCADFRSSLTRVAYRLWDNEKERERIRRAIAREFVRFEALLGEKGGPFILGSDLTIADFVLYDVCDVALRMAPGAATGRPALQRFLRAFEAHPSMVKILEEMRPLALNNRHAKFGSEPEASGARS